MKINRSLRDAASWEETGRGPGTWPSGLGGDAAAAGAAGAAGGLRSASPCGSVPGRQSRDDDASLYSTHLHPYHLRKKKTTVMRDSIQTSGFDLNECSLGCLYNIKYLLNSS